MAVPSHERPIFLVLPGSHAIAEAFVAVLSHDDVRAYALPALWDLGYGGADPMRGLSDLRRLELGNLDRVVAWSLSVATPRALEAHAERAWAEVGDRVREFFLRRSLVTTLAAIFRIGRSSSTYPPTPTFVADRVREARFEAAYRLARDQSVASIPAAPAEEASLVFYPFDPRNEEARGEAGLSPGGPEAVIEAFAYEDGRERHRSFLERVAKGRGWRVLDPGSGEGGAS